MALVPGHGTGAGTPRIEVSKADRLPPATGPGTAGPQRDALGRFLPGNAAAKASRVRVRLSGITAPSKADPQYRIFARWGTSYAAHRRAELARLHGGTVSAGVGAILESAAQALAAARFLQWKAAQTGDPALFGQAGKLSQLARQHELAAWELAAREATSRPTHDMTPAPWILTEDASSEGDT